MIGRLASWYWRRVKEIPFVVGIFTLGCVVEAVFMTSTNLAYTVLAMAP